MRGPRRAASARSVSAPHHLYCAEALWTSAAVEPDANCLYCLSARQTQRCAYYAACFSAVTRNVWALFLSFPMPRLAPALYRRLQRTNVVTLSLPPQAAPLAEEAAGPDNATDAGPGAAQASAAERRRSSCSGAGDLTCAVCLEDIPLADMAIIKGCDHMYCGAFSAGDLFDVAARATVLYRCNTASLCAAKASCCCRLVGRRR